VFGSRAGAGQGCEDKEPGSVRVVTPRFSPSPPLRSFLSINPRKSQRTDSLSLYVSSISSFSPSSSSSPPFLILFAVSNDSLFFPRHFVFLFIPFLSLSCHWRRRLSALCRHVPLPWARTFVSPLPIRPLIFTATSSAARSPSPPLFPSQTWLLSTPIQTMTESVNPPSPPRTLSSLR
jgi:hypothetical protein